jgi:hypothetical protein
VQTTRYRQVCTKAKRLSLVCARAWLHLTLASSRIEASLHYCKEFSRSITAHLIVRIILVILEGSVVPNLSCKLVMAFSEYGDLNTLPRRDLPWPKKWCQDYNHGFPHYTAGSAGILVVDAMR